MKFWAALCCAFASMFVPSAFAEPEYAVVISKETAALPEWKAVADALVKKHDGALITCEGGPETALAELTRLHPRYTAFVEQPTRIGRIFVALCHRTTRKLDDDPYGDTRWGIVSSATSTGALRMAQSTKPEVIRSAMCLTGCETDLFERSFILSDGKAGSWQRKNADGTITQGDDGRADRVQLFVSEWNKMKPELLVGSGHATEQNLEMPFSRGNTVPKNGRWVGMENWRTEVPIEPDATPRVFVGAGNCLIGNFKKSATTMAPTLIETYGVNQYIGYIVPSWYGKGGWGTWDSWKHCPGRYSLADAFFMNNQVILHTLITQHPEIARQDPNITEQGEGLGMEIVHQYGREGGGMMFDRDVIAFYGDPAQRILLDSGGMPYDLQTTLVETGPGVWCLTVKVGARVKGIRTEKPLILWTPRTLKGPFEVTEGQAADPLITNDFVMLFQPGYGSNTTTRVVFKEAK